MLLLSLSLLIDIHQTQIISMFCLLLIVYGLTFQPDRTWNKWCSQGVNFEIKTKAKILKTKAEATALNVKTLSPESFYIFYKRQTSKSYLGIIKCKITPIICAKRPESPDQVQYSNKPTEQKWTSHRYINIRSHSNEGAKNLSVVGVSYLQNF